MINIFILIFSGIVLMILGKGRKSKLELFIAGFICILAASLLLLLKK